MLRVLLIFHRYAAVTVGLLMALWSLSGFVMLCVHHRQLDGASTRQERSGPVSRTASRVSLYPKLIFASRLLRESAFVSASSIDTRPFLYRLTSE